MRNAPLIVEDVMLLLHDEIGTPATAGTLFQVLGGAVLVELALRGTIGTDGRGAGPDGPIVVALDDQQLPDPLLRSAHDMVARRSRRIRSLLPEIGITFWTPVVDRLVERGLIRRRRSRALGLYPVATPPVADTRHEAALRRSIGAVLEDSDHPDTRTAAVIALLSASGAVPRLHLTPTRAAEVVERAKVIEHSDWAATAVTIPEPRATGTHTAAAVAASSAAAPLTTPA